VKVTVRLSNSNTLCPGYVTLLQLMQHFSSQTSSFPLLGKYNTIFVATFCMSTAIPCQLWYLCVFLIYVHTKRASGLHTSMAISTIVANYIQPTSSHYIYRR